MSLWIFPFFLDQKLKAYAGIGSRETPPEILEQMASIAGLLARVPLILRSGGADGADQAFEIGCTLAEGPKEIFLPWQGFNGNKSPLFTQPDAAFDIAQKYHPRWNKLRQPVRKLMARNSQQVLGQNLDSPVAFVICWTPDGCINGEMRTEQTGGTGQAIEVAAAHGIPVYNIQRELDLQMVYELIRNENLEQAKS